MWTGREWSELSRRIAVAGSGNGQLTQARLHTCKFLGVVIKNLFIHGFRQSKTVDDYRNSKLK